MSLNWSDLIKEAGEATNSFEPLPDGDYELKVIEAKATTSASGKVMFKTTNEVVSGPYAKRRVWDNLVISPENSKALGMFFMKMGALGLGKEFFNSNPTNAQIEQALLHRSFRGTLGTRTYNGTQSNEISKYFAAPAVAQAAFAAAAAPAPVAAAPAPAPAAPVAAAPAPAPAVAPAPAPAAPVTSDDTPF
jgi:pyruvate/2-oxoglutarate dehydrogenase complex dihydrolipoamide acyltransferase (E2) component